MYVADTATNGLRNSTNGTNNNADVNTYATPVIIPRHMAVIELPPAFCDKYSDAVIDSPADTAAIIPVSIIMYCVASANASPVTNPNVDTNASCIPSTNDDQMGSFFFIQKNLPPFVGKYKQDSCPWVIIFRWGSILSIHLFADCNISVHPHIPMLRDAAVSKIPVTATTAPFLYIRPNAGRRTPFSILP